MTGAPFSPDEMNRYSRHLLLPEVGLDGQRKLKSARALVAGSGGLGSPVALYLAAAGVGTIGLVDFDAVDLSNLQRQILFSTKDVGKQKAATAAKKVQALNDSIEVKAHDMRIAADNVLALIGGYDLVVDGTDNFATRYLLNDSCVKLGKPYIYGSIYRFEGQATVFTRGKGCYRCLFPVMPDAGAVPNCAEIGVLGAVAGVIGLIQATEALKVITGIGQSLAGRLLIFDALDMRFSELPVSPDSDCTICNANSEAIVIADQEFACTAATQAETLAGEAERDLSPAGLQKLLHSKPANLILLDVRTPQEYVICSLEGAMLIPLNDLPTRLKELGKGKHYVVYCHHGVRSRSACQILRESGFAHVSNLRGGISAWSKEIDKSVPQY